MQAQRYRFKHMDMSDLDAKLKEATNKGARIKMIATDGRFWWDQLLCLPQHCIGCSHWLQLEETAISNRLDSPYGKYMMNWDFPSTCV